ncbi:PIG-L deacetylase family protein [Maricaulis sp.]|uniref:PIG-L deacetylase family protein n=1 Tax=Maricaulis sp. TaxID=1486257 RepID=UPI003A8FDD83
MPRSPALRILIVIAGVLALLLAAAWLWLDSLFEVPGTRTVPSVAGEVGAQSVLAVFAHPDDEQSITGLLIRADTRDGAVTRMITSTRGEAGTPLPQVSRMEELGIIRHAEVLKNGWALGLEEQEVWDYPDGGLPDADFETYVERLMERMQAWQPDLVVTFWPESGLSWHPDHRTAGRGATEAVRRLRELDPDNAPRAIAYILAPPRMMAQFGGETGQLIVDNQPAPNLQMPGEAWAKVRGWQIHASQRDYLQHAYGFPTQVIYGLYDKEHYYLVEF